MRDESKGLVERLRGWSSPSVSQLDDWILDAADHIEALEAEIAKTAPYCESLRKKVEAMEATRAHDKLKIAGLEAKIATYGTDVMWVCFGCGAEFSDDEYEAAAEHFGMAGEKDEPSCIESLRAEIARLKAEGIRGWAEPEPFEAGVWFWAEDSDFAEPKGARPARLIMEDDDG